jgi:hypothetical protein
MPLTSREFDTIVGKLKMSGRDTKHRLVWFEHAGRKILWTERSHGRGDLGNVEHAIRRQLKVSSKQLSDLAHCPMTRDAYVEHLLAIGAIDPQEK